MRRGCGCLLGRTVCLGFTLRRLGARVVDRIRGSCRVTVSLKLAAAPWIPLRSPTTLLPLRPWKTWGMLGATMAAPSVPDVAPLTARSSCKRRAVWACARMKGAGPSCAIPNPHLSPRATSCQAVSCSALAGLQTGVCRKCVRPRPSGRGRRSARAWPRRCFVRSIRNITRTHLLRATMWCCPTTKLLPSRRTAGDSSYTPCLPWLDGANRGAILGSLARVRRRGVLPVAPFSKARCRLGVLRTRRAWLPSSASRSAQSL